MCVCVCFLSPILAMIHPPFSHSIMDADYLAAPARKAAPECGSSRKNTVTASSDRILNDKSASAIFPAFPCPVSNSKEG